MRYCRDSAPRECHGGSRLREWWWLLGLLWVGSVAAGPVFSAGSGMPAQPLSREAVGLSQLAERQPQLAGDDVTIGLVELCQPAGPGAAGANGADLAPDYAFMPNLRHEALSHVVLRNSHYYHNPYRPARCSSHATTIAGILFGLDAKATVGELADFSYRGIVPNAALEVFEANWFLYRMVLAAEPEPLGCDILNLSWGTTADDDVTMWWQRGIDALAQRENVTIIAAAGNELDAADPINKPSWGWNLISVASANPLGGFPDHLRYLGPPQEGFLGPTVDGRAKPDCLAPGLAVAPSLQQLDGYTVTHHSKGYSSFAAPHVAGIAGLLTQYAREQHWPDAEDPRVLKALLLNGANKLVGWHKGLIASEDDPWVPLDYQQGAGLVDAYESWRQLSAGRWSGEHGTNSGWDLATIAVAEDDPCSFRQYTLPEPLERGQELRATITWFRRYHPDRFATPLPLATLVLECWQLDSAGQLDRLVDVSHSVVDPLQHLFVRVRSPGSYALVVRAEGSEALPYDRDTFAFACSTEQVNWSGDQYAADLTVDGVVDAYDMLQLFNVWQSMLGSELSRTPFHEDTLLPEDLNGGGRVESRDMLLLLEQWQKRSPWAESLDVRDLAGVGDAQRP